MLQPPIPETSHTDSNVTPQPPQGLFNGTFSHHPLPPTEPHLPSTVFLQRPSRKLVRPSTAPAMEDVVLLPSGNSKQAREGQEVDNTPRPDGTTYPVTFSSQAESLNSFANRDGNNLVVAGPSGLHLGSLPSPFLASQQPSPQSVGAEMRSVTDNQDLDWPTFIHAYANGRWDPHRTPHRPRSSMQDVEFPKFSVLDSSKVDSGLASVLPTGLTDRPTTSVSPPSPAVENPHENVDSQKIPTQLPAADLIPLREPSAAQKPTFLSLPSPALSFKFHGLRTTMPLSPPTPHRLRNSFSNVLVQSDTTPTTTPAANAELQTTVATMRWAAARVDISPLALPSPEHELADPMRGVTAALPGNHPPESYPDYLVTPGGTRRSRLTEFWEGTTDIEDDNNQKRCSCPAAPSQEKKDAEHSPQLVQTAAPGMDIESPTTRRRSYLSLLATAPPATAPSKDTYHASDIVQDDYFGDVGLGSTTAMTSAITAATTEVTPETTATSNITSVQHSPITLRLEGTPLPELGTVSVPATTRRICLTRQISSPLPAALSLKETRALGGRIISDTSPAARARRASREEQLFDELQYLVPPDPPDELERRRALYKYNIWNTGPDMNFDRIAHLAKLVFNTKGVMISLIDGGEIWQKSEWGVKDMTILRSMSFCGHAVLQRGDEPMVIMDAHADWRFARNPKVIGGPRVRFYAGAPLRTQDGFNVGTLALMDDVPREEFSPRQRHTLKEFAAIVMREMELWRDKIQLRIRDRIQNSMEQFSRECLEIDEESPTRERADSVGGSSMDKVYDRAAKLVKRTLDVEGVVVMDVSHCEILETMGSEANVAVTLHVGEAGSEMKKQNLTTDEYHRLNIFFAKHPEGKISEGIMPPCFRPFLPTHIQYALTVPIYNIDKQLFALICAYNASDHTKRFLEGHELSYLRAIGVIILSAVLKRRMILADKAKSLFISNISHELRTPLHGILAAAELLGDTSLDPSQLSYLQTVQACGTSLVETVNHVLDFTKLSGNAKSGGLDHIIMPSTVDLMQLVEEAIDGCWVGHRARTAVMGDSGIGSVYSPPKEETGESPAMTRRKYVETVIDIGYRKKGWTLKCEKGGIRRVLMNLFGNSLKFTADGFIHVMLHRLPRSEEDLPNKVKVELVVLDSGKGISQNFLKNQLFHPFSQENPLQTGTGLGLAIVSSIVTSEAIGGKVDVWSQEGVGTEIKVTFNAEVDDDGMDERGDETACMEAIKADNNTLPTVSLAGFHGTHRGTQLLERVLHSYLGQWWHFDVVAGVENGDIVILNEDISPVVRATESYDISRPFIVLSSSRGNPSVMQIATEHEHIGGFCRILYKPGGPTRLRSILKLAVHARSISSARVGHRTSSDALVSGADDVGRIPRRNSEEGYLNRRPHMGLRSSSAHPVLPSVSSSNESTEKEESPAPPTSPLLLSPQSGTTNDLSLDATEYTDTSAPSSVESLHKPSLEITTEKLRNEDYAHLRSLADTGPEAPASETGALETNPSSTTTDANVLDDIGFPYPCEVKSQTIQSPKPLTSGTGPATGPISPDSAVIPIGDSGTLLKSSILPDAIPDVKKFRVLVVEDNGILRNLLTKWLASKGYEFRHAVDGQAGVSVYTEEGPFDVVLLDLSMPVLDGVSATAMIRKIEREEPDGHHARILALTGMSSLEDKRRAFEAGVDGYLIKPVAFKTLDEMFHKMGLI